jgi:hypothetical protein
VSAGAVATTLPAAALAIERSSNVYWLRRDRRELWFETRGFELVDPGWSRLATDAAWIASAGDAIAVLEPDGVTAFTAVGARPLFAAPGLGAALADALAAVVDPVRRVVYVATPGAIVEVGTAGVTRVAARTARALALSTDRRRLYAATDVALDCVTLDDHAVTEVAALPASTHVAALASSPMGVAATATLPTGPALLGISPRFGSCTVLAALPADLAGAPVVADHTGMLTLAATDRLYRCGFDGSELGTCFTPQHEHS